MAHEYAHKKIKEAIEQSGGSQAKTCQTLIEWAIDDKMLLLALTQNHLKNIVAHLVEHACSNDGHYIEKANVAPKEKPKPIDMPPETFGRDLLKALSSRDTVRFGMESTVGKPIVTHRKKASKQHVDSLKKMSVARSSEQKENR